MARKRVVSRTIAKLTATVAVVDLSKNAITDEVIELPVACKTEKGALKFAQKEVEKDKNKRVVAVREVKKTDVKYEMPEEDFIKNAKVVTDSEPATADEE